MPNLLKIHTITPQQKICTDKTISLSGITSQTVETLGKTTINLFGHPTEFHIIPASFPIPYDGIIGNEFFQHTKAKIDYDTSHLIVGDVRVPFEHAHPLYLRPRTRTIAQLHVINEIGLGYLPLHVVQPGVFYGNALAQPTHNKIYIPIINTTEQGIQLPPQYVTLEDVELPPPTTISAEPTPVLQINAEERTARLSKLINIDHLQDPREKDEVLQLIKNSPDCFHLPDDTLTFTTAITHKINTTDDQPIHVRQYRFPPILKDEITKQVDKLLKDGIIKHSHSPYNTPTWCVPKKSGPSGEKKWRMVLDFRKLNEKTIGDSYPLPNIVDIFDQLGQAKYFSTFDLASGFHQILLDKQDTHKTAFSTPHGHYEFVRMPFGLCNAPATFQRLMDTVLTGLQGVELFVYLDDIVIYAKDLQEHREKYNKLIHRLREANLKLQPEKCTFLSREVAYLGHILNEEGIKPDEKKLVAVKAFPTPKDQKNIRQFLGLAGYYRRFIPNFSAIAQPLTHLLKKDKEFLWQEGQQAAFELLKQKLCEQPVLRFPDFTQPFVLTTDASGYAIGGILSQGEVGKDQPISYVSKILSSTEQKYSTYEKEAFAIVYCIHYFRPYLYGHKFTIVCDHKPLVWMKTARDPTSRLARWRLKIEEYDYDIVYREGRSNTAADALSRNPVYYTELIKTVIEYHSLLVLPIKKSLPTNFQPRKSKRKTRPPDKYEATHAPTTRQRKNPYDKSSPKNTQNTNPTDNNLTSDNQEPIANNTADNHDSLPPEHISPEPVKTPVLRDEIANELPDRTENYDETAYEKFRQTHPWVKVPDHDTHSTSDEDPNLPDSEDDKDNKSDDEIDPLTNFIIDEQIKEHRDPLSMMKDNIVIFLTPNGQGCDSQSQNILKHKYLGKFDISMEPGTINCIKTGKYYCIGICIQHPLLTSTTWEHVSTGLTNMYEFVTTRELETISMPKIKEINNITWNRIFGKIKNLFAKTPTRITICLGIVTNPPLSERDDLIQSMHNSRVGGHKGVFKTYHRLRAYYYWERMKEDVQSFIQQCLPCKLKKLTRIKTRLPMAITDTPVTAFAKCAMDIVGPLPLTFNNNKYILTIQDLLTKYCAGIALPNATAQTVAEAFIRRFVCIYGAPKAVLTDQGTNFLSDLMKRIAKCLNIKQYKTTAFHPQTNGSLERSHHTLVEYLKQFVTKEDHWDQYLELALLSYNTSIHEGTKKSPYELVFGRTCTLPASQDLAEYEKLDTYDDYLARLMTRLSLLHHEARQNLIQAKEKSKTYYDKKVHPLDLLPGSYVFLKKEFKTGKFDDTHTGPHLVVEVLDTKNAKIKIKNKEKVVSIDRLKKSHISG